MKRLIIGICLIGIVYVLGTLVTEQILIFIHDASLIMSGVNRSDIQKTIIDDFNKNISDETKRVQEDTPVTLTITHLDTDHDVDLIAKIDAPEACGTGGCIPSLLLKNDAGKFEQVRFGYAVKNIEVAESITNGMHDLKINKDFENLMTWDGKQYTFHNY